ncbi:MAG: DNA polymerase III subunit gamma/tau [Pseudomonadota bacterium]|nr:MAG: DNA polymerase III subunit gamma/tau [Pseudomonadota bacterium]
MSYQVLARKWRPRTFAELVGQEHVRRALVNALDREQLHHAFLFTGTRGVGKTTIARILAKSMNCEAGVTSTPCGECGACREIDDGRFVDLIEVDAASRTKVEDTRELLENVQYAPTRGRFKVYLIDEVHMLSGHSFNALLKTLEEPPPHVKFLLATTDPQKLPVTILSRCLQFNLRRLPADSIRDHLSHILGEEGIEFEPSALAHLARAADGSMRDALSILDQAIAYGGGKVLDDDVRAMLGTIEDDHVYQLLDALGAGAAAAVLEVVENLAQRAPDFETVLNDMISVLHRIALLQQLPEAWDESWGDEGQLRALAQTLSPEDVQLFYQIGITGGRDLPLAPDPRAGLEMVLLRMLAFRPVSGVSAGSTTAGQSREPQPAAAPAAHKSVPPRTNSAPAAPAKRAKPVPKGAPQQAPNQVAEEHPAVSVAGEANSELAEQWHGLVGQVKLAGVVYQLAMHCTLTAREGDNWRLTLDPPQQHLQTKDRVIRLEQAMCEHFGKPVRLELVVEAPAAETPAARAERLQAERQASAVASIEADGNVKALVDTFGGQVRPDSIQPTD